tara:strand:- start:288 stop:2015 length:1728 start_codon:yes stop_codon:yes gene_type:complete
MLKNIKRTLEILNNKQKKQLAWLTILILISVSLELFSISLLVPLVYLLIDPTFLKNFKIVNSFIPELSNNLYFIIGLSLFVFVFLIKSIFVSILQYANLKITNGISLELTSRLFNNYLNQDYIFHVKNNTAKLLRNVISEAHHFADIISQSVIIVTEVLVVVLISILVFYLEPRGFIFSTLIIIFTFLLFYSYFKKKVRRWGQERLDNDLRRIKSIQQGLNAIKEIKVYNLEKVFSLIQYNSNKATLLAQLKAKFMQFISRPIFEISAVLSLSIFLLILFLNMGETRNINDILPVLVLLSGSLFRLLPAMSSINVKIHHIKYIIPSMHAVYSEMRIIEKKDNELSKENSIEFKNSLNLKNLSFSYEINQENILEKLNFSIKKNEIIGIVGLSGVGKSTLIDLMLGLINPIKGEIILDGVNINSNIRNYQNILAYVPQNIYLIDDSVKNNIIFGKKLNASDDKFLKEIIEKVQLSKFIDNLDDGIETQIGERGIKISGGERQRIAIARALYRKPKILFFDEATSSLDNDTENKLIDSIRALKGELTIVMVAHRISSLRICDQIYEIKNKNINKTLN